MRLEVSENWIVRYLSIFFGKKITDRTNPGCSKENSGNESQIIPASRRDFKLSPQPRGNVFNGEFDSGSERTLAAWIRHASRAGFVLVAIPREIQRRTGA
jgi:hypothetical protein